MIKQKDPQISIKLSEFVEEHLGDNESNPFRSKKLAEYIEVVSRDTFLCAVQWEDENGQRLEHPLLWRWAKWQESCEKWKRAKIRSEQERIQRFIFESNVISVKNACMREFLMDEKFGQSTAFSAVKNNKKGLLMYLNVTLKTKEEEL